MRLPATLTVAEAVTWLVGNRVAVRTDLSGALLGSWRLDQGGQRLDPDARVGSLNADQDLELRFVPNTILHVEITIVQEPAPVRFFTPVGGAVPVCSLVDHLAGRFDLPPGSWTLFHGDRALSPWALLDDLGPLPAALALTLRRGEDTDG